MEGGADFPALLKPTVAPRAGWSSQWIKRVITGRPRWNGSDWYPVPRVLRRCVWRVGGQGGVVRGSWCTQPGPKIGGILPLRAVPCHPATCVPKSVSQIAKRRDFS